MNAAVPPPEPPSPAAGDHLVVVAHPDDEILWLGPLLPTAAVILAAFPELPWNPELTRARASVLSDYPLRTFAFLPLAESGAFRQSDWLRRRPSHQGVTLARGCPPSVARRYSDNFVALLDQLTPHLREHPVVYTHNPWGEYGHEEHIQVCAAVTQLARAFGRSVWAWTGLPDRQLVADGMRMRRDHYGRIDSELPRRTWQLDLSLYRAVRDLYIARGAWTYDPLYIPPAHPTYMQLVRQGEVMVQPAPSPSWSRYLGIGSYALRSGTRPLRQRIGMQRSSLRRLAKRGR
jgi:LmbE family N-acetylglucosaminyl deacetylase